MQLDNLVDVRDALVPAHVQYVQTVELLLASQFAVYFILCTFLGMHAVMNNM